ncbi:methyltransferase [Vibrio sp. SM6]|uniref:Methyltransferase n=1 Tax=Vibrio agarilyticus TaxID=2726741 RepID=A0A7X8TMU9_9VIBR|nr:methyltransferase [Vibrio agarilyticus]NLS11475.1 methyltransferase [Vibrio agarilyticus]
MLPSFTTIDALLTATQSLWRFEPFHSSLDDSLPWQKDYPALCAWLEQLTPNDIAYWKTDVSKLITQLGAFIPELSLLHQQTELSLLDEACSSQVEAMPRHLETGIPGRKLTQIQRFANFALLHHHGDNWLEWCAGKGYLGRLLAASNHEPVVSLEYQAQLCQSGQHYANQHQLPMHFVEADAFSDDALTAFKPQQHAIALHACGDLHVTLLKAASAQQSPAITIAPCCYHLTRSAQYQALSQPAQASGLKLTQRELRIPLQQTVTGGERVHRHRQQEMIFRLGFDLIAREQLSVGEYLPIPSIKKSQLAEGFEALCHWAAAQKSYVLPLIDFSTYESRAVARFWHMERLSLVQMGFQRALELWLVLDRALYLQERGYKVALNEFCGANITPRNILLHAERVTTQNGEAND